MMERTDRHCRFFLRLLAPHAWLYTEMITAVAVARGDREHLLAFHPDEHPVALQLGGNDPAALAAAAHHGQQAGYDEINLNVGCPSDRVRSGRFGAALMATPERVAECVAAMSDRVRVPVTVKTRLGIDDCDSYGFLRNLVQHVARAGCRTIIVHARKALLSGLSPKENREIPPLDYERVYRLKTDFPALEVVINGGLDGVRKSRAQLDHVDGVMLGRRAYREPYLLAALDAALFGHDRVPSREHALAAYLRYIRHELSRGTPLNGMTRHLMGLYAGQPGARRWRRLLSELPPGEAGLAALAAVL
jgi:tRNA-dihydrouridine synthase A